MVCAFLFLIAAEPSAHVSAKESPKVQFATPGDMVFTSGTAIRFSASAPMIATAPSPNDFGGEATFALAMDYFLVKRFSIGAFLRAGYSWSQTLYGPGFGVGPRVGYHFAFSDWVGLWPRLDLSFGAQSSSVRATSVTSTQWFFNATMNLPLVFSILDHVVLGVGPYFAFEPQWAADTGSLSSFALNFGVSSFIGWHF